MSKELTTSQARAIVNGILADLGQAANAAASQHVFADYRSRKAENTIRRQDADLSLFADFLREAGGGVGDLAGDPQAWHGITWGLVAAFQKWQLARGYAVSSINGRVSTIKMYAKLAMKAGAIDQAAYGAIRAVEGYSRKQGKEIDKKREGAGLATRYEGQTLDGKPMAQKKADFLVLTREQLAMLKDQPDTPQGRRDRLMICLMADLGLRAGEVSGLTVSSFDLERGKLTFYREKVDKYQTHRLINGSLAATIAYFEHDAPTAGPVLRQSGKAGKLHEAGMTARNISHRIRVLGERIGIDGLSAHDLRHTWATMAAEAGTPLKVLMEAGGWNSEAMPLRYIKAAEEANQGVKL